MGDNSVVLSTNVLNVRWKREEEKAKTTVIIASEATIRIKNRFLIKESCTLHNVFFLDF